MTTRRAAALVGSRIPALRTMGTVAFVAGWAGEQYALPHAVAELRQARRARAAVGSAS